MSYEDTGDVLRTSTLSYLENACLTVQDVIDDASYQLLENNFFSDEQYTGLLLSSYRIANKLSEIPDIDGQSIFVGLFIGASVVEIAKIDIDVYSFALAKFAFSGFHLEKFQDKFDAFASDNSISSLENHIPIPDVNDFDFQDYLQASRFALRLGLEVDINPFHNLERQSMVDYVNRSAKKLQ